MNFRENLGLEFKSKKRNSVDSSENNQSIPSIYKDLYKLDES